MKHGRLFCFVLFCFVLCDRQHSSSGHMAHHRPRMCAAGHTPHPLCGAVRRPRVRLQPIRILEAFAGRDAQSVPSERLTGPLVLNDPSPATQSRHKVPVILVTGGRSGTVGLCTGRPWSQTVPPGQGPRCDRGQCVRVKVPRDSPLGGLATPPGRGPNERDRRAAQ